MESTITDNRRISQDTLIGLVDVRIAAAWLKIYVDRRTKREAWKRICTVKRARLTSD